MLISTGNCQFQGMLFDEHAWAPRVLSARWITYLGTQLSRHNDFTSLRAALHDEAQDAIAGTAHGQAAQQFVSQGLSLGYSTQPTVCDLQQRGNDVSMWQWQDLAENTKHCKMITFSAYSSTDPSGNLKRFCTTLVSSRMRRPFTPAWRTVKAWH